METRRVLVLFAFTAAMIFLYGGIDYTSEPYSGWDLSSYRAMAASSPGVAGDVGRPFAHRLLGPYLAGLPPLADPAAFRALAIVVSLILVVGFYLFLRRAGLSGNVSVTAAMLLVCNKHWFGFTVWDYFQVNDVLSLLFILAMSWSMLEERWTVFGAALLLGALTKETSMLMVPVLCVYLVEKKAPARTWGSAFAAVAPGLVAFAAVRLLVPAPKGMGLFDAFLEYAGKVRSPERVVRLLFNSWLPVSVVPILAVGRAARFFRERKWAFSLALLSFAGALFGANDERLMAPVFVVVYYLAGAVLEDLGLGKRALALVVVAGFAASLHHIFARYPLPDRHFTQGLSLVAVLAVTGTVFFHRAGRSVRRTPVRGGQP